MGVESVLMVARWEGCGGTGEEVRGVRSTNRWSQNSHGDVKYSTAHLHLDNTSELCLQAILNSKIIKEKHKMQKSGTN